MVLTLTKREGTIRVRADQASDLSYLPGKTDWDALEELTDEEIAIAAVSDPDQPPFSEEEMAELIERIRQKNADKFGQGGAWADPNKKNDQ